ncbi:MAG: cob(I)yrinic acid a,c-diamide adenosyltransferase [Cytophagaceae bacterium]|jgi:cob(I)alamin adenosyltransferase|nr:cob(I)yrinic acid a,c-diamide adenosyltransferase [Cytophagaceae bacterium]
MKIYTKTGDKGTSSLLGGTRVTKDDIRLEAYGTTDELNATLALLRSKIPVATKGYSELEKAQWLLFEIGAALATESNKQHLYTASLSEEHIEQLEKCMDEMTELLPIQKYFVLPPPIESVALAHVSRTICRRSERLIVRLQQQEAIHPLIIPYLNRLSDFLFVLSRYLNLLSGSEESYWMPEK